MHRTFVFCFGLTLLCSCSTAPNWAAKDSIRPPLPSETSFNIEAGHRDHLFVKLRLENGTDLLFVVDTGASITVLDKSLEPLLGKRLGTTGFTYHWGGKVPAGLYNAPKLYLGSTQLLTGDWILTDDLKRLNSGQPLMGILGTDCLRHYCIQLDFAAYKIRFFDPDHLESENLGEVFPITLDSKNPIASTRANFFGQKDGYFIVDTGATMDAALKPKLFKQVLRNQTPDAIQQKKFPPDAMQEVAWFSTIAFDGLTYRNFILGDSSEVNVLGLRFMARHLVTLNFPKRAMFLQRRSDDPFANETSVTNSPAYVVSMEAEQLISNLKKQGQLPGLLKDDRGKVSVLFPDGKNPDVFPVSPTFNVTKTGDSSVYHYTFLKASKDAPWKLQRAWRTDSNNQIVEEYPVQ